MEHLKRLGVGLFILSVVCIVVSMFFGTVYVLRTYTPVAPLASMVIGVGAIAYIIGWTARVDCP